MSQLKLGQYFVPAPPPEVVKKYFGLFGTETIYHDDKMEEDAYYSLSSCTMMAGSNYKLRYQLIQRIVAQHLKAQKNVIWLSSYHNKPSESSVNLRQLLAASYPELEYKIGFVGMSGLVTNHLQEVLYSTAPTWQSLDQFKFHGGQVLNCYVPWEDIMAVNPASVQQLIELLYTLAKATQAIFILDWECETPSMEELPGSITGINKLGSSASFSDDLSVSGASTSSLLRYTDFYLSRQNVTPTLLRHLGWDDMSSEDLSAIPDNILIHYQPAVRRSRFIVLDDTNLKQFNEANA